MKKLTQKILDSYNPCYPASRYYDDTYEGDILQLAKDARIPFQDRLWVIMRNDLVSDKFMRLFAVWCTRRVVSKKLGSDPRSINALNVAVAYAFGEATQGELSAAWSVVAAAGAAAADVAAACSAAAPEAVAPAAAAWSAVAAAGAARTEASHTAAAEAADSARSAAWSAQEKQLIAMIEAGIHTGDVK